MTGLAALAAIQERAQRRSQQPYRDNAAGKRRADPVPDLPPGLLDDDNVRFVLVDRDGDGTVQGVIYWRSSLRGQALCKQKRNYIPGALIDKTV